MNSLTTIWQFTSVWILLPDLPAKVAKTELNKSFSIDQRINDFFSLCSPSCKSSIHAKHVWFLLLAVLVTWWNHATLLAELHIISRRAKFCSLRSQFFRAFQFFLKFSLACVTALFVLFHLLSLALTRFNSRHCSVFSTISPPFLNCPGPRTLFHDLATFSAVNSCSVSVSFMLCLR